jgi:hypothetical protein
MCVIRCKKIHAFVLSRSMKFGFKKTAFKIHLSHLPKKGQNWCILWYILYFSIKKKNVFFSSKKLQKVTWLFPSSWGWDPVHLVPRCAWRRTCLRTSGPWTAFLNKNIQTKMWPRCWKAFSELLTPHPLSTQGVCPPLTPKAGGSHSPDDEMVGGGGSIVRKTPDIGLASYSIIPLRASCIATHPSFSKIAASSASR